jgi:hypothetical protein
MTDSKITLYANGSNEPEVFSCTEPGQPLYLEGFIASVLGRPLPLHAPSTQDVLNATKLALQAQALADAD